jgi:hypothetical protein
LLTPGDAAAFDRQADDHTAGDHKRRGGAGAHVEDADAAAGPEHDPASRHREVALDRVRDVDLPQQRAVGSTNFDALVTASDDEQRDPTTVQGNSLNRGPSIGSGIPA